MLDKFKYALAVILCCTSAAFAAESIEVPKPTIENIEITYTDDIVDWTVKEIDKTNWLISKTIAGPANAEFNFHTLTADFSGTGTMEVSVGHSTKNNIDEMIEKKHLHSRFQKLEPNKPVTITSRYKGQRFAWIILKMNGRVAIKNIKYSCQQVKNGLYGHVPGVFEFAGGKLPYRLMYPKNYDPSKSYPLVVSVHGSGGVGGDNSRSMEMVTLARYLYTKYYNDKDLECFSLVPQVPKNDAIPAPFCPKGKRGAPSKYHPDFWVVNSTGWYTRASVKLIKELTASSDINIDPERVYMTGFSLGGKACWEFLKASPGTFAAAASGGGWPIGKAYSTPKNGDLERLKWEVMSYKHVPVLIFAGEKDLMRFGSEAVNKEILKQGGKTRFMVYKGASHVPSAGRGWGDINNIRWIFTHKKK